MLRVTRKSCKLCKLNATSYELRATRHVEGELEQRLADRRFPVLERSLQRHVDKLRVVRL